jgi:GDPmannose 4,6-dehydratase
MYNALITGISGQDGPYLAKELLSRGVKVVGAVRSLESSLDGLKYLDIHEDVDITVLNLLDAKAVYDFVGNMQFDFIFNLAAQSSVANSFQNPHSTILFNLHSTLNLLEAIRNFSKMTRFYQATSSEMYGAVGSLPISDKTLLNPLSPYAISKSSCHYLVKNYRESYGLHASSGILFNHESVLRRDSFFIMKVIKTSLDIYYGKKDFLEVGNIDIKRDFGYAPDYVNAMLRMVFMDKPDDYIICSGKSITLRSIIYHIFNFLGIDRSKLVVNKSLFRPAEIIDIYGDNSKAKNILEWNYDKDFTEVIEEILLEYKLNFYHV